MTVKEVIFNIVIPLIAGFLGGGISNVVITKSKMKNRNVMFNNNGDVINGNRK